jgi:predicted nucleotidyltransferase component of viral defense system
MIAQRNLPLLANRLLREHGGRRIPEAVLEPDYCLAWFLVGLSQSRLGQLLIFKGGTALKRCHFGDCRFFRRLRLHVGASGGVRVNSRRTGFSRRVAQASGIRFAFDREDRQHHSNSYTFYLSYQGPLPNPNTVKVDITISEVLCFPVEQRPGLRAYPEFEDLPEDRPVAVYGLNEIATEKVVALSDPARNEPRDLYDLWYLTNEAGVDLRQLVPAIKLTQYQGKTSLAKQRHRRPRRSHSPKRAATEGAVDRPARSPDRNTSRIR